VPFALHIRMGLYVTRAAWAVAVLWGGAVPFALHIRMGLYVTRGRTKKKKRGAACAAPLLRGGLVSLFLVPTCAVA